MRVSVCEGGRLKNGMRGGNLNTDAIFWTRVLTKKTGKLWLYEIYNYYNILRTIYQLWLKIPHKS